MSNLIIDKVRNLMGRPAQIRNVSVVAHVGHGKSVLTDCLIQATDVIPTVKGSEARFTDAQRDDQARGITTKSTAFSLYAHLPDMEDLKEVPEKVEDNEFLLNLIDSPGHVDFSSEVTAALRVTDGALVIVDTIEGVCMQTETVLRQASDERIKPIIIINKIDRALLELQFTPEDLYQSFSRIIKSLNVIIATYFDKALENALGDAQVHPSKGTVAFGSGVQGWAFTVRQFASKYAKKFGIDRMKMTERLWGDNYFNPHTKKWTTVGKHDGNDLDRSFNQFILNPIFKIFSAFRQGKINELVALCDTLDIKITDEEKIMPKEDLLKKAMCKFLPAADTLLEIMVLHLPSPVTAQKYRAETLYEGPLSDAAYIGIRDCDPTADLMLYVSKMVPTSDEGRFYAFGRVFAGTVRSGVTVRIQGPDYVLGTKEDLFVKSIQQTILMTGRNIELLEEVPAGSIIGLVGIDQFLLRSGTLTTSEVAHNFKAMKFSVSPVVQRSVDVKNANDLPKLVEGLKRLSKSDLSILTFMNESGEHIVAGAGQLHLEICLENLEKDHADVSLRIGDPIVAYRETVQDKSSMIALSKSPNRFNRLYVVAEPLGEEVSQAIECSKINPHGDPKQRARILVNEYEWDVTSGRNIWAFGPDTKGPNMIIDQTKAVRCLNEIKNSFVSGFQWATKEGPIAEEPMRGVRFNIVDVTLFSDAIHRGGGQIIPAARRVTYASFLLARPALQEPIFLVEISVSGQAISGVYDILARRRGRVLSETPRVGTLLSTIKAYLPVAESFDLDADLRAVSSEQIFSQSVFNHWEVCEGSVFDVISPVGKIVTDIRRRKGIAEVVQNYESYYDKL